ncbi:hypothetical protein [Streptomyces mirabilis]|uniref:hypothetical protein n=1 Tax=Streptomyces mirabilis TaxID=68239 RepID=UPI0033E25CE0
MALLKRVDWQDNEIPHTDADRRRYEQRVARVRKEVTEIRSAAEGIRAAGGAFDAEVADFLAAEARMLEGANEVDGGVELQPGDDTAERPNWGTTTARRALLIARAWHRDQQVTWVGPARGAVPMFSVNEALDHLGQRNATESAPEADNRD